MKLNKYNMEHKWITGALTGQLVVTMIQDVTPGEVWYGNSTSVIRMDPLNLPTFMSYKIFRKKFFVPYRILDSDFPDWWTGQAAHTLPTVDVGSSAIGDSAFNNMMGSFNNVGRVNHLICAYPRYAYNMIWNKHFRPEGVTEVALNSASIHRVSHPSNTYLGSIRDSVQVGSEVTVDSSGATIGMTEIRDAWTEQRLAEHRQIYGDKYVDQLKRFGCNIPFGLVDEPVPVSSGRGIMGISEVVETSTNVTSEAGQMKGHGIVMFSDNLKPRKFMEPGILMEVAYARPRLSVTQNHDRIHIKSDENDFYQPELALKSDAVVTSDEIYVSNVATTTNFGYVDNYEWLRGANDVTAGVIAGHSSNQPYSAYKRLSAVPTINALQYVDDYDDLFQNAASGNRADVKLYVAHKVKKLSPVRRRGRS